MEQELANKLIESVNQLSTFTMNDDSKMIGMLTEIEYTGETEYTITSAYFISSNDIDKLEPTSGLIFDLDDARRNSSKIDAILI